MVVHLHSNVSRNARFTTNKSVAGVPTCRADFRAIPCFAIIACAILLIKVCLPAQAGEPFAAQSTSAMARVVIVEDLLATEAFRPRLERNRTMICRGMTNLT